MGNLSAGNQLLPFKNSSNLLKLLLDSLEVFAVLGENRVRP